MNAATEGQRREVIEHILRAWRRLPQLSLLELFSSVRVDVNTSDYEAIKIFQEFSELHAGSPEVPELTHRDVFYFGCWSLDKRGRYLYNIHGITVNLHDVLCQDIHSLDGIYCGSPSVGYMRWGEWNWEATEGSQPQNRARLKYVEGWTIFAFWDRTADQRYGSNAALLVKNKCNFEQMCELFQRHFPAQWKRITEGKPMLKAVD